MNVCVHKQGGDLSNVPTQPPRVDVPIEKRVNNLLSTDDARDRVHEMDAFSLYNLVRDVDDDCARSLVSLASAEQSQAFLDFDCWNRDQLDCVRLGTWLRLFFQGDDEKVLELSEGLDPELLGRFLREHIHVYAYQIEEDADIIDAINAPIESSPDGVYAIVMPADHDTAALVRLIIHRLYFTDQDAARQFLYTARWELNAELEENAYRVRSGRLEQYGFLPTEEAAGLYARVNPKKEKRAAVTALAEEPRELLDLDIDPLAEEPVRIARELSNVVGFEGSFFGEALRAAVSEIDRDLPASGLMRDLAALINMSVAADLGDPSDRDFLFAASHRAHGFLNIGLQYLSDQELNRAVQLLKHWPLKRLFSVGHSLVFALAAQARKMLKRENLSLVDELPASLCGSTDADLLDGLGQLRPLNSRLHQTGFSEIQEVEATANRLALIAYKELWTFGVRQHRKTDLVQLFVGPPRAVAPLDDISFDSILATTAAAVLGDGSATLRLMTANKARILVTEHLSGEGISDAFSAALAKVAALGEGKGGDAAKHLAEIWTTEVSGRLTDEYGNLESSSFDDPEFLSSLLLIERAGD